MTGEKFMDDPTARNFFGVVLRIQTWKNLFYLMLAFPLGTFYFGFLAAALSVGVGLSVLLIGIPVLLAALGFARLLGRFEIGLANAFLDLEISQFDGVRAPDLMASSRKLLLDSYTWKSLIFLLLKFPLGILSFVMVTVLGTFSLVTAAAPFLYTGTSYSFGTTVIDSFPEAAVTGVVGALLIFVSLHIFNALARGYGRIAAILLGDRLYQAEE